jgi:hypothetical protein
MTLECPVCCESLGGAELLPEVVVSGAEPLRFRVLCQCGYTVPVEVRVRAARRTSGAERQLAGLDAGASQCE